MHLPGLGVDPIKIWCHTLKLFSQGGYIICVGDSLTPPLSLRPVLLYDSHQYRAPGEVGVSKVYEIANEIFLVEHVCKIPRSLCTTIISIILPCISTDVNKFTEKPSLTHSLALHQLLVIHLNTPLRD